MGTFGWPWKVTSALAGQGGSRGYQVLFAIWLSDEGTFSGLERAVVGVGWRHGIRVVARVCGHRGRCYRRGQLAGRGVTDVAHRVEAVGGRGPVVPAAGVRAPVAVAAVAAGPAGVGPVVMVLARVVVAVAELLAVVRGVAMPLDPVGKS